MIHLFLLTLVLLVTSAPIDLLTPLNFLDVTPHKISGGFCSANPITGKTCGTGSAVIDPPNQRYKLTYNFDLGNTTYYSVWLYLGNTSYTWGNIPNTECFIITDFNFATQVSNYGNAVSLPGSFDPGWASYLGLSRDGPSCGNNEALWFVFHNGLFNQFQANLNYNIDTPDGTVCVNTQSIWYYDQSTVEYPPFDDDEFYLRSDCYNAPDYCSTNPAC